MLDFKHTRISRNRRFVDYSKVQGLISALIRNRRSFIGTPRARYLNIGCGPNVFGGFYNLDYSWRPGIDACWDICRGLPFESNIFQGVFSEHCLEHVSFCNFKATVSEIFRVLKPGGTLRVVVPDAELYIRGYVAELNKETTNLPYREINGELTALMSVNRVFRDFGHQYAWDYGTMKLVLESVGFFDVARCEFREGRDPELLICNDSRRIESLYVEATRP